MDPSTFSNVAELLKPGTDASLYAAMEEKTPFSATQASLGWWLVPTFYSTLVKRPETASSENNKLQLQRTNIENYVLHPSAEELENYFGKMEELGHKKGEWPKDLNDWMFLTGEEEETWFTYVPEVVWKFLGVLGL